MCVEKGNNRVYRTDESSWFVNPWLSVDVWPARMEFDHALHLVRDYLSFSLEVFVKHSVADRGFYVVFNFVNVFFEAKYDSGIAFVGRINESLDLFFIKDFKAVRCLGVRLTGV